MGGTAGFSGADWSPSPSLSLPEPELEPLADSLPLLLVESEQLWSSLFLLVFVLAFLAFFRSDLTFCISRSSNMYSFSRASSLRLWKKPITSNKHTPNPAMAPAAISAAFGSVHLYSPIAILSGSTVESEQICGRANSSVSLYIYQDQHGRFIVHLRVATNSVCSYLWLVAWFCKALVQILAPKLSFAIAVVAYWTWTVRIVAFVSRHGAAAVTTVIVPAILRGKY